MQSVIDNDHYCLMKKVCYKNLKTVMNAEDMDSLIYYTYAQCLKNYKSDLGQAKFTTYLHHSINNNSRKIYLKIVRSKEKQTSPFSINRSSYVCYNTELFDILDSLKDIDIASHDILIQKFLYGMTNEEIGKANGYCREAARKKVKKALNICREIVYS